METVEPRDPFRDGRRTRPNLAALALLAGLIALALGASLAAPDRSRAATEPFRIQFDRSDLQIGMLGPLGELPLDTLSSTASIDGTWDPATGQVTVPKGKFTLPTVGIADPVKVEAFVGIEDAATGSFDPRTGALSLDAKAGLWVSVNIPQLLDTLEGLGLDISGQLGGLGGYIGLLGDLTCGFAPMNLAFTTGSTSLASGAPFVKGTLGAGALTTEWSRLGPFAGRTKLLGFVDACALIKDYLPSLIGGLGGGSGIDLSGIDLAGLLDNLDAVDLGPSGLTLTRTVDESGPGTGDPGTRAKPARLRLAVGPKRLRARPGRMVGYSVKVRNVGGRAARKVKVCVRKPQPPATQKRRCRKIARLAPGAVKRRAFKVRFRPSAKRRAYRVTFEARAGGGKWTKRNARVRLR